MAPSAAKYDAFPVNQSTMPLNPPQARSNQSHLVGFWPDSFVAGEGWGFFVGEMRVA